MISLGKITGLSSEEYHGEDAISHSKLEVFRRRPALYKKQFIDRAITREETAAFAIGSALHCIVLENGEFSERYAIKPEGIDRRTKEGKAEFAQFELATHGKTILTGEDATLVRDMFTAIHYNPTARELLFGGEAEVSWRAPSAKLPHPLQCRTDYFNPNGCALTNGRPYVVDIKTVDSLDGDAFRNFDRAFLNFGYHRQCGFYLPLLADCGVKCWDFFFVVVEKREPFGCVVYKPNEDAVCLGMDETVNDLRQLAECYQTNSWPNMPEGVQEIGLPDWYVRKNKEAA